VYVLPQIQGQAKELISEFFTVAENDGPQDQAAHSLWDKVRMTLNADHDTSGAWDFVVGSKQARDHYFAEA
jgi:hypothetical protein